MDEITQEKQLEWTTAFPGIPGWYWVYQALPKGNGESFAPVWIETAQSVPMYSAAFYGPMQPPTMPETIKPLEYQRLDAEKPETGEQDAE